MRTLKIFSILPFFLLITVASNGQVKTESFKVSGNCGMCKTKIEKAAKEAGATFASWDADQKQITVKYNSKSTNAAKIQQQIAKVGYDNAGVRATDDSYNKLHGCCKYDRDEANASAKACCGESCEMKDGKCTDMTSCKDKGCCSAEKCKGGEACKHDASHDKASCCKGS